MMSNKVKKDTVANTLITTSDIALIIVVSIIVALVFTMLSLYNSFVNDNQLLVFSLFEVVAFCGVLAYKRWK